MQDARESVYFRSESLRALMEWVTFYQSFDSDGWVPDMAAGEWEARVYSGNPQRADGLVGKALIAGTGMLLYPAAGNWTVDTRGAVAFFVCPMHWTHENAGNTEFMLSSSAAKQAAGQLS